MRILFAHLYDDRYGMGGAEKVVLDLAVAMKDQYGHEICCAVNSGMMATELSRHGIAVREIEWSKWGSIRTLFSLKNTCNEFRPTIVHSHHRYTTFLLDLFYKKHICLLHTEHVLRCDKRLLFRPGHFIAAVHDSVRDNLIKHYRVPGTCVKTIPNAVCEREASQTVLRALQDQYPKRACEVFGLSVGRLEKQKGYEYLILALAQLPVSCRAKIKIFVAGDGSLRSHLVLETQRRGLNACLFFLGHTPHVREWLEHCDFFLLPSLWEGMPLSVLEAYAASKGVLATDIPGTREIVDEGVTGRLVPSRNSGALSQALKEFTEQPGEKFREMGRAAYVYFKERFSYDHFVESYHNLYLSLQSGVLPGHE